VLQFFAPYIQEITVALIGVAIPFIVHWLRNLLINLRYNISGEYISTYSDLSCGAVVEEKTVARLKQVGNSIRGKNVHWDGRIWYLQGDFLRGQYYCGIYYAEAKHDQGAGSFFFDYDGVDFNGLWAGYDNKNRLVFSGAYQLRRMARVSIRDLWASSKPLAMNMTYKLRISHLLPRHRKEAIDISNREFGAHYLTEDTFTAELGQEVVLAAQSKGAMTGFLISYLLEKGLAAQVIWPGCDLVVTGSDVEYADQHGRLGVIKTVAVATDMQSRGIGTKLIRSSEKRLRRLGASCIVVPAWERADGSISIAGVLKHLGFEPWERCNLFWRADCEAGKFTCACRQSSPSCACNMVLFKKSYTQ